MYVCIYVYARARACVCVHTWDAYTRITHSLRVFLVKTEKKAWTRALSSRGARTEFLLIS